MAGSAKPDSGGGFDLPLTTEPMEARASAVLPPEGEWQYEPKWDGFRCLAFKSAQAVDLRAKSGKPLGRYFPEILALLRGLEAPRFIVDGELVIEIEGQLSFEALQMRLHPAESRVRRLAKETPAHLVLFDMLATTSGEIILNWPLRERRAALEAFAATAATSGGFLLSPATTKRSAALRWLGNVGDVATDGVVAKRLDGSYACGAREMVKVKRLRTADCVVGGFRYLHDRREVGSLLLGLYNTEGKLDHVGFTSNIDEAERPALTHRLEALAGGEGFTGNAPGGPSRWNTERNGEWEPVRPELVVEVQFDHVSGGRFRHGTKFLRWRPDKAPRQCTKEQFYQASGMPAGEV